MKVKHIDNVIVVSTKISLISGTFKITEEDLGLPSGSLPPDELASLGSMKYVDPDILDPGHKIKRQVERTSKVMGLETDIGTVIPAGNFDEFVTYLEDKKKEFNQFKQTIINQIDSCIADWIAKYPKWEDQIKKKCKDSSYAAKQLDFRYQVFMLSCPKNDPNNPVSRSVNDFSSGLKDNLFNWVASTIKSWKGLEDAFQPNGFYPAFHLKKIINVIGPKLKKFEFLDGRVSILLAMIDKTVSKALLQKMPVIERQSVLTPNHGDIYRDVKELFSILMDEQAMLALSSDVGIELETDLSTSAHTATVSSESATSTPVHVPKVHNPIQNSQCDFSF